MCSCCGLGIHFAEGCGTPGGTLKPQSSGPELRISGWWKAWHKSLCRVGCEDESDSPVEQELAGGGALALQGVRPVIMNLEYLLPAIGSAHCKPTAQYLKLQCHAYAAVPGDCQQGRE